MNSKTIFFDELCGASQGVDVSVTLGLLWMAACDGSITPNEQKKIAKYYNSAPGNEVFQNSIFRKKALAALKDEDSDVLEKMCDVLKKDLNIDEQQYFFRLLIDIASAEDAISVSKNYILRFFLDLFEIESDYLSKEYLSVTGELLPELGDPSSPLWWDYEDSVKTGSFETMARYRENLSEAQARHILGLSNTAIAKDIKMAYRRLAQHYHPDRHEGLDDTKRKKLEQSFLLVQQAYEVLKR
jgi:uncharacterized tellurite resistance protein B-like protein